MCLLWRQRRSPWAADMVPGQDLSIGLQALLVWLGNTDICPIELQQELIGNQDNWTSGGTLQATNSG